MKYCSKCGAQLPDEAIFCHACGRAVESQFSQQTQFNQQAQPNQQAQRPQQPPLWAQTPNQVPLWHQRPPRAADNPLTTAAKVLMIIGTVVMAIYTLGIALAWCLPMTIAYSNSIKEGRPVSTGFKVCTLLFVSLVAGILMLCENSNNNRYYY